VDFNSPNKQADTLESFFPAERQRRLDLILHLIPNTRQVILLRGPVQSGKSFFIGQLQNQIDESWQFCSLLADKLMQTEAPLQVLAEAISGRDEKNHQILVRLESWSKLGQKVIICVENAYLLAVEQFDFLFKLADNYECLHIILTSSENLGESVESRCQLVDLEPFTQKQTTQYAKKRVQKKGIELVNLAGFDEVVLFIETGGLPGRINDVLEQMLNQVTSGGLKKVANGLPIMWLVGAAMLLTGALLVVLYPEKESGSIETVAQIKGSNNEERPIASLTLDEVIKLPNKTKAEPAKNNLIVETSPAPIVLSPSPVQEIDVVTSGIIKTLPAAENEISLQELEKKVVRAKPAIDKEGLGVPKEEKIITEIPKKPAGIQIGTDWIKSRDKNHYTLQLLGVSTEESAHKYILKHKELKSLYFFQNKKNDGKWFSVIYGDFVSKEKAVQASKNLPPSLGRLKPWVRSFGGLHADLYRID
jgi:DamX protein